MLNTSEYQYIKDLTNNYYSNDYNNYLCITNNPDSHNYNVYDVFCYYSKDNINISNNKLSLSDNSILCKLDSNNYSDNNTIDKLVCDSFSGNVDLSTKEYIYSNLDNYANIIGDYQSNDTFYKSSYIAILSILSILVIIFLYNFVTKILRR